MLALPCLLNCACLTVLALPCLPYGLRACLTGLPDVLRKHCLPNSCARFCQRIYPLLSTCTATAEDLARSATAVATSYCQLLQPQASGPQGLDQGQGSQPLRFAGMGEGGGGGGMWGAV